MVKNAAAVPYTEYKLWRKSQYDSWEFKGKVNGTWKNIISSLDISPYFAEMLSVNYGVSIHLIPHQTGKEFEPVDLSTYFLALRFDPKHHLGLGDIRLTIAEQEEISQAVTPKPPPHTDKGD